MNAKQIVVSIVVILVALVGGYLSHAPADRLLLGILAGLCAVPVSIAMIALIRRRA